MGRSLIDTSILIEVEKQRLDLTDHIRAEDGDEYYISVITVSELLHGVHRAHPASVQNKRAAIVEEFLDKFPVLNVDRAVARSHARLWADLETSGNIIGGHDLWLAATCLAQGLKMITANVRDFGRVQGLVVENWSGA